MRLGVGNNDLAQPAAPCKLAGREIFQGYVWIELPGFLPALAKTSTALKIVHRASHLVGDEH